MIHIPVILNDGIRMLVSFPVSKNDNVEGVDFEDVYLYADIDIETIREQQKPQHKLRPYQATVLTFLNPYVELMNYEESGNPFLINHSRNESSRNSYLKAEFNSKAK